MMKIELHPPGSVPYRSSIGEAAEAADGAAKGNPPSPVEPIRKDVVALSFGTAGSAQLEGKELCSLKAALLRELTADAEESRMAQLTDMVQNGEYRVNTQELLQALQWDFDF